MIDAAEIFPWNDNFATGIAVIDEQHQRLVRLLNTVAAHFASGSNPHELNRVFDELAAYAVYHFETEEAIWQAHLPQDEATVAHVRVHHDFVAEVVNIRAGLDRLGLERTEDDVIQFLTHWLAFHILDSDKHMAKVVLGVQSGLTQAEAKAKAQSEMSGAMCVLIETLLKMYDTLSVRTLQLMREVADRQRAESQLRLSKQVIDNTLEAIVVLDHEGRIVETNPSLCQYLNQPHEVLLGQSAAAAMPAFFGPTMPTDVLQAARTVGHWKGEVFFRNADNRLDAVWMVVSTIVDEQGVLLHYAVVLSSASYLLQQRQQLEAEVNHDVLTGLPNRRLLQDRLQQQMVRARRRNQALAVCFMDLDGFKLVNDRWGHEAGDTVLRATAHRVTQLLRAEDTVARLGGDEFVLLLGHMQDAAVLGRVLNKVLNAVAQPIAVAGGGEARVTASIGVAFYPADATTAEQLLIQADQAMYAAKHAGKSQFVCHRSMPETAEALG